MNPEPFIEDKERLQSLDRFTAPLWGQDIELIQVEHRSGGMPLLRIRIREKKRFTIFDIDAQTAERWALTMLEWARRQKEPG